MTYLEKLNIVLMIVAVCLVAVFHKSTQSETSFRDDNGLDWAVIECGQGNPSACQLEKNLLKSQ